MDRFCFLKNYSWKLYKSRTDTKHTGENVDVEAGIIKTVLKQQASFFNKTEAFIKTEIRKCIINQQQAKESHWYPEKQGEEKPHWLLQSKHSWVVHKVGFDEWDSAGSLFS